MPATKILYLVDPLGNAVVWQDSGGAGGQVDAIEPGPNRTVTVKVLLSNPNTWTTYYNCKFYIENIL